VGFRLSGRRAHRLATAWTMVRGTEGSPRPFMAGAEPRFDFRDFGQLVRREIALERVDRFHQVLRVAAPFDRIIGEASCMLEGLVCLVVRSRGGRGPPADAKSTSGSRSARR
jgi:hypothetical protein